MTNPNRIHSAEATPKSHGLRTTYIYVATMLTLEDNTTIGITKGTKIDQTFVADCFRVASENAGIHFAKFDVSFRMLSVIEIDDCAIINTTY